MLFLDEPPVSEVFLHGAEMLLLAHWAAAAETLEESPATYRTVNDCGLCPVCKERKNREQERSPCGTSTQVSESIARLSLAINVPVRDLAEFRMNCGSSHMLVSASWLEIPRIIAIGSSLLKVKSRRKCPKAPYISIQVKKEWNRMGRGSLA